jgi:hypothetical protein
VTTSSQPTENSQGQVTWNPSVGLYFEPASPKREGYGGVIAALQDQISASGNTVKSYPENFAGIIAAIQDLRLGEYTPGSDTGNKPPGGDVIINDQGQPEWIITEQPVDGQLWFDTRQGRMFVWLTDNWYQTNGGDGIPIVTLTSDPPAVDYVVAGQLWYDKTGNNLFIFAGDYQDADGNIGPDVDGSPIWVLLSDLDRDFLQTTATLPLDQDVKAVADIPKTILPEINSQLFNVQKDYNIYLYDALAALETAVSDSSPLIETSTAPPADPSNGQLWYDTESLELSIYYQDDNSSQWVPTSVTHSIDSQLEPLRVAIATEASERTAAVNNLTTMLNQFDIADNISITHLENLIIALEAKVDSKPVINTSLYVGTDAFDSTTDSITSRLVSLETATPDYSSLISKSEAETEHAALETLIATKATPDDVAAVAAQIPNVSNFIVQQNVTDAIANITTEYLPRTGGVLTGSFQLQKNDYALPSLDFSGASWYSRRAFKLTANAPTTSDTTFGTTDNPWEYAWEFGADEDFCWIYNDTNKVFSINKEGPACSTIYLGDLGDNTNNGRVIHNKIDVKERLNTYQTAFHNVRQAVSSSTDYASLKSGLLTALATV